MGIESERTGTGTAHQILAGVDIDHTLCIALEDALHLLVGEIHTGDDCLPTTLNKIESGWFLVRAHIARERDKVCSGLLLDLLGNAFTADGYHVHSHGISREKFKADKDAGAGYKTPDAGKFAKRGRRLGKIPQHILMGLDIAYHFHRMCNVPCGKNRRTRHAVALNPDRRPACFSNSATSTIDRRNKRALGRCKRKKNLAVCILSLH